MRKVALCVALVILSCGMGFGAEYKVLWSFGGAPDDGAIPMGSLVADGAGNLYGATAYGGTAPTANCSGLGCGTIYRLSPNPDSTWTDTVLYSFCSAPVGGLCLDGQQPGNVLFDAAGNLYGTTVAGGPRRFCPDQYDGCGTVFKLTAPAQPGGAWTEAVLYDFCTNRVNNACLDGDLPVALTFGPSGNLYGITYDGGSGHLPNGIVFELSPAANGWNETVLYNFCSVGEGYHCSDGSRPTGRVAFDQFGNLYGATEESQGLHGIGGIIYELSPGVGGWTETIVHDFRDTLRGQPLGGVSFDVSGNLYTTAFNGGGLKHGEVFRVSPEGRVRTFSFDGTDGSNPRYAVLSDSRTASVYGTTEMGGLFAGTVFKIGAQGKVSVLHNFCAQPKCADGYFASGSLIEDSSGNLYGATEFGGANQDGVVFEIIP